jgi:hypothetical protein
MVVVARLEQLVVTRFGQLVIGFRPFMAVGFRLLVVAVELRPLAVVVAILEPYFSSTAIITFTEHTSITSKVSFIPFNSIALLTT